MKYIAKMMLAALASVALAVPAYAWDFNASGSASASFNSTTTTASTGADAVTSGGVTSEGSSLKLASSNKDGDNSASFSYTADWDGNLDQTIAVSGSKKAGAWTASAGVSYNLDQPGCSNASYAYATSDNGSTDGDGDNETIVAGSPAAGCQGQTGEDTTAVTVTDGTMTIVLGEAGHLSGQNVSSNSVAGGSVSMDSSDDDLGVGAFVDSFHGVSLGYKVSDTIAVTVAYQTSGDANDLLGAAEFADGEVAAVTGTTGFGVGASIGAGPATIGLTVGSASTKDNTGVSSASTSASVMGLGVKMDFGDAKPFISFGQNSTAGSETSSEYSTGGMELGTTFAMGDDSIVFYYGSVTEKASASADATTTSGMELGYGTSVGPASLGVGYGTKSNSDSGYAYSDLEVKMSMSF